MVLGMVGVSVLAGFAATGAGVALDLPTWAILASYPAVGALTLLMAASLWSIRDRRISAARALMPLKASSNARIN